jgi:cell fate regulator YaaT (PSP1 superfamily)
MNSNLVEYLVSYGKSGAVGRFATRPQLACARGDRVVIESSRGQEVGVVLCPASDRHQRLLPDANVGQLLRHVNADDEPALASLRQREQRLFEESRRLASQLELPIEVLDVEVLFDNRHALLQHLGWQEVDFDEFVESLSRRSGLEVLLENLALAAEPKAEETGCGKPDCGRASGSSCSTCGTGGGCGSCSSHAVDMRPYFAHLRSQMEQSHRVPLT